ncbi:hypothetical protein KDH_12410 [Dictyobacter sp. S3.2.2.5]|uniref:Uncharacterized protein n=1 Tax=Dictyobacter halimunensis TaxID=3026934 RepID=A0ABQ6FPP8_9CHLR|nr:hypothetical protein KDH_12410 [Dictyobacter sp. S3.2.2.5]
MKAHTSRRSFEIEHVVSILRLLLTEGIEIPERHSPVQETLQYLDQCLPNNLPPPISVFIQLHSIRISTVLVPLQPPLCHTRTPAVVRLLFLSVHETLGHVSIHMLTLSSLLTTHGRYHY